MRRCVLMIIDGLRADMLNDDYTPALAAIARHSTVFSRHRAVFPSATRINSASIATGCYPQRHGLGGNAIALDEGQGLRPVSVGAADFRDRWRRATGHTLKVPTLVERLRGRGNAVIYSNSSAGAAHMQDPDSHGFLYHRSGSFGPDRTAICGPAHLDVSYDARGDDETTRRFCTALESGEKAALHVLWVCEPDHSQHQLELGSAAHREILLGADLRARQVAECVERLRGRGEEVLFILASDHGHETATAIVPVTTLLREQGFIDSEDSTDIVLASSGMSAGLYFASAAKPRREAVADWLRAQDWCGEVFCAEELAQLQLATDTPLQIVFSMAKQPGSNPHGIPGLGAVAADPFMTSDCIGHGQHGGLGEYECHPFLLVCGEKFAPGERTRPSSAVDIAPTLLEFLGQPYTDMDGEPLPKR